MSAPKRPRLLRLHQIIAPGGPIPVSRSTWYEGVRNRRFPQRAETLGGRIAVWYSEDIDQLTQSLSPSIDSEGVEGGEK